MTSYEFKVAAKNAIIKTIKETYNEEYEEFGSEMSGRRGRAANGRYVSRDGGNSYMDGYSRGYAEAMNQSGHWPMRY